MPWDARLRRSLRSFMNRPGRSGARVPRCRCAGACRCGGMTPYLLLHSLEVESEFYRGVM